MKYNAAQSIIAVVAPSAAHPVPKNAVALLNTSLRKLVVEVRYKPHLGFYAKMDQVALSLSDDFPDWERTALTVEIISKSRHQRLLLTHKRCFFESDLTSGDAVVAEYEKAVALLSKAAEGFDITQFQRVGVRQWFAVDVGKTFANMVDEIMQKWYRPAEGIAALSSDTPTDVAYVVDFDKSEGWKYHLRFGAMTREEWFERVPYDPKLFEHPEKNADASLLEYRTTIPQNFMHFDIDCYGEDVQANNLSETISTYRRHAHELVNQIAGV